MKGVTTRLLVLALLVVSLTSAPAWADLHGCVTDNVDSYEVSAESTRSSYWIGQTAVIYLHVTDSVTGEPARHVDTGITVDGRGRRVLVDASRTDDNGDAVLRVELRSRHVEPGWADTHVAAWQSINTPVYCTGRYGYRSYPKLFRIRS